MVGLFVTSLVGLYTIEDLWDKFGDLKMSWVSFSEVLIFSRTYDHVARPSETLGGADRVSHRSPYSRVYDNLQDSLLDPQPFWTWGRTNELAIPSKSHRERLCK